jgi:Tol biopolymer transport system component
LTRDPAWEFDPSWSRSGKHVAFNSDRTGGRFNLFARPSNGSGADALLVTAESNVETPVWSPVDDAILYTDDGDLWLRPSESGHKPFALWKTKALESAGTFSPDGRWIAYISDKSGRPEIYVRAFPSGDDEHKVSRDGGMAPRWRADGREIFFLSLNSYLMGAEIDVAKAFKVTNLEQLFQTDLSLVSGHPYAVARDGRFLMPVPVDRRGAPPITALLNWPSRISKPLAR